MSLSSALVRTLSGESTFPLSITRARVWTPVGHFSNGEAGAWYDLSDLATLFTTAAGSTLASVGDPVGRIEDKSGNGNHATQGTASARPVLRQTASGRYYLEGDATQWLRATFAISQPWTRISTIRQITWTSGDAIFGGATASAGWLQQISSSPNMRLVSGLGAATNGDLAVGTDGVVSEVHDGADSSLTVNNGTPTTGDAGTTLPGGITIFANDSGANIGNVRCYGLVMVGRALTDIETARTRNYLAPKAGIVL